MYQSRVAGGSPGRRGVLLLLGAALLWACGAESINSPAGPNLSHEVSHTISGSLLGPDGRNICNTIGSGTMLVQLLNPDFDGFSNEPFLSEQDVTCPENEYSLPADAGNAYARVTLPLDAERGIGLLPWKNLDVVPVGSAGVAHDFSIVDGTALGGRATLNGSPMEGIFLQVGYEFNGNFGATSGASNADGVWEEFFGRHPMRLRNGVRTTLGGDCGLVLGTRLLSDLPTGGFEFPRERATLDCTMETGPATRFSHTATRVVVTPLPGDIGGSFSQELFDRYGVGWGVQFPIAVGSPPITGPNFLSEMFKGGLILTTGDGTVLTGVTAEGLAECGASCRDLGLDGTVKVNRYRGGKKVTWRYSDATSAERVGVSVTQRSYDGTAPHDYVLFRFSIRNTSRSTLRFHAGFAGDWDVEGDAGDDLGATDLGGKLMYQTSENESGIHVGTMLLGKAPISGNYFFNGFDEFPSVADQVQALAGGIRRETSGPGDMKYFHGAGPITLKKNQTTDLWIAVVAGENKAQLLANARAAQADVASGLGDDDEDGLQVVAPAPAAPRAASRAVCQNCKERAPLR
jgi:hypothetical protein